MNHSRRRMIPEQEWETHKETIERLFLIERKILLGHDGVLETMCRNHGFYASKAQYETRLKKWGFRKYGSREQWTLICHALDVRQLQGKRSQVFFGNDRIPDEKIEKERKRYKISSQTSGRLTPIMDVLPDNMRITTPPLEKTLSVRSSRIPSLAPQNITEPLPANMASDNSIGEFYANEPPCFQDSDSDIISWLPDQCFAVPYRSSQGQTTTHEPFLNDQLLLESPCTDFQVNAGVVSMIDGDMSTLLWNSDSSPPYSTSVNPLLILNCPLGAGVKTSKISVPMAGGNYDSRWDKGTVTTSLLAYLKKNLVPVPGSILGNIHSTLSHEQFPFFALFTPPVNTLLHAQPCDMKIVYLALHCITNNLMNYGNLSSPQNPLELLVVEVVRNLNCLSSSQLSRSLGSLPELQSKALYRGLFYAALEVGSPQVVEFVLTKGVGPINEPIRIDGHACTPLQRCWINGHLKMAQVLVNQGADPNGSPNCGPQDLNWVDPLFRPGMLYTTYRMPNNATEIFLLYLTSGLRLSYGSIRYYQKMVRAADHCLYPILIDIVTERDSNEFKICGPLLITIMQEADHDIAFQVIEVFLQKIGIPGTAPLSYLHVALCESLRRNHVKVAWKLLNSGVEPTTLCLTLAVRAVNIPMTAHLLSCGLSPVECYNQVFLVSPGIINYPWEYTDAGSIESDRAFPISEAIRANCAELTDMMMAQAATQFRKNYFATCESILAACEVGNEVVLGILLSQCDELYIQFERDVGKGRARVDGRMTRSIEEAFPLAIRNGHLSFIPRLIDAGIAPGPSALCAAITARNYGLTRLFIEQTVSADLQCKAFHAAIQWGQLDLIQLLIMIGFSTSKSRLMYFQNANAGISSRPLLVQPISLAILCGHAAVFELLLEDGCLLGPREGALEFMWSDCHSDAATPPPPHPLGGSYIYLSPLAAAVRAKDRPTMERLLELGENPCDNVAILEATLAGDGESIKFLLDAASTRYRSHKFGEDALLAALDWGNVDLMNSLLSHTDSLGKPTIATRIYTFGKAIMHDGVRFMKIFIDNGSDLNGRLQSKPDSEQPWEAELRLATPLLLAISTASIEKVRMLVEAGAQIDMPARHGLKRTPLQAAVETGALHIIEYLIGKGANVDEEPAFREGFTALQIAAAQGFTGIANMLIERGANVNAPAAPLAGRTALEAAAEKGRIEMLSFLSERSNLDIASDGGKQYRRAVMFAKTNGHVAAVDLVERLYQEACVKAGISLMAHLDSQVGIQSWNGAELGYGYK